MCRTGVDGPKGISCLLIEKDFKGNYLLNLVAFTAKLSQYLLIFYLIKLLVPLFTGFKRSLFDILTKAVL